MSSSSGLAAARRRRGGIGPESMQNGHSYQNIPPPPDFLKKSNLTPLEILKDHDKKLFYLERFFDEHHTQLEKIKTSGEILKKIEPRTSAQTSLTENISSELMVLKTTVYKLSKSLEESNSIITTLRASIISQANEINNLKEIILVKTNFTNLLNNKDMNINSGRNTEVSTGQSLDVSEEKVTSKSISTKLEPNPIVKQEINPKQKVEDIDSESDDSEIENEKDTLVDKSVKEQDDNVDDVSMKKRGRPKKEVVSIDNLDNYTLNSTKIGEVGEGVEIESGEVESGEVESVEVESGEVESVEAESVHATILRNNRKQNGKGKKKNNVSLELSN
jgi:hypothetical protein